MPNAQSASGLAMPVMLIQIFFSGFYLTKDKIPPWFIWAYWIRRGTGARVRVCGLRFRVSSLGCALSSGGCLRPSALPATAFALTGSQWPQQHSCCLTSV